MENIKTLYYERFIQHVVESYSPKLKAAKAWSLHEDYRLGDERTACIASTAPSFEW